MAVNNKKDEPLFFAIDTEIKDQLRELLIKYKHGIVSKKVCEITYKVLVPVSYHSAFELFLERGIK